MCVAMISCFAGSIPAVIKDTFEREAYGTMTEAHCPHFFKCALVIEQPTTTKFYLVAL